MAVVLGWCGNQKLLLRRRRRRRGGRAAVVRLARVTNEQNKEFKDVKVGAHLRVDGSPSGRGLLLYPLKRFQA